MDRSDEIKRLIGRIGRDPKLIDELVSTPDHNQRKGILAREGILQANDVGFSREEVIKEVEELMRSSTGQPPIPVPGARPVDWVLAIGSAVGSAVAAACTAD